MTVAALETDVAQVSHGSLPAQQTVVALHLVVNRHEAAGGLSHPDGVAVHLVSHLEGGGQLATVR